MVRDLPSKSYIMELLSFMTSVETSTKTNKIYRTYTVYLECSKSNNMPAKVIGQKTTASSQDHLGPGHLLEMNLPLS